MNTGLDTVWLGKSLMYFEELDSTNAYLKEHAENLPHGAAVIAKRQTKGRGRLGRSWMQGGEGDNLALSVLLHGADVGQLSVLPLVTGVAVASALEELCGIKPSLKWSNDVLLDGLKLCGILCESRITEERAFAVLGIGVNLSGTRTDFERLDLVYAASIESATNKKFRIFEVAAEICGKLERVLEDFEKNGFGAVREEYKRRCVTLGKEVRVIHGGGERRATAVDIGTDGSLICETDGEVIAINAGEACVRGIYGYV